MAVIVYSTPTCSYCNMVKDYFKKQRVPFTDYNVAQNLAKADEMVKKSGQMGVPVVDIHGKIIVGFNQSEIDKALKR